jgi:hypothetical protein
VVASPYWQKGPAKPGLHVQPPVALHVPLPLQVVAAEQKVQVG